MRIDRNENSRSYRSLEARCTRRVLRSVDALIAIVVVSACGGSPATPRTRNADENMQPEDRPIRYPMSDLVPYTHASTGLVFPWRTKQFERTGGQAFDRTALGVRIDYRAGTEYTLTVYIYDLGLKAIPSGADSGVVQRAFKAAESEIYGYYYLVKNASVTEIQKSVLPLPGTEVQLRVGLYSIEKTDGIRIEATSWLLMTACRGHFFKIRYSAPLALRDNAQRMLNRFLATWTAINSEVFNRC